MSDGRPVLGSFNQAYKNYSLKRKYPWCLKISIGLDTDKVFTNGLPKGNESRVAEKEEDSFLAEIKKLATAHYIGHLFNDSFLDIYIYLDDPVRADRYLKTQVNSDKIARGFGYQITQDPAWTNIKGFMK